MSRKISFVQAINEGLHGAMQTDEKVLCFGLGVDDPKRIFGTTSGLQESFGPERVFDMPTSENGMTGIAIGAALRGYRPVMVHQRLDFFLLAMDQLVNGAAKWRYMFGGQFKVPITIRLVIGRGWGQGPTHSQSLHAWFAHIPGLKVVMPTTPAEAKGLLTESIFDDNPVVFIEHRWLHQTEGEVPEGPDFRLPLGQSTRKREGDDLTIVSISYMTVEAIHAIEHLKSFGVSCDLIDMNSVNPIDWQPIFDSVKKTGRLLVLDTASETGSVAGEVVARVATDCFDSLKTAPQRICLPDFPTPTSPALTENFYRRAEHIVEAAEKILGGQYDAPALAAKHAGTPHDVPGDWFRGPF